MPPLVEITLQTLKGVSISNTYVRLPKVTAAVAFSGSAEEMRVGSSFVCPKTGNLMVESHCANTLPRTSANTQPLIAHWNQSTGGLDVNEFEEDQHTHVSIYLPPRDPRLPSMPISGSNRDSKIVRNVSNEDSKPSVDESDVSSQMSEVDTRRDEERGGSVFWSQSEVGAVMPEIVELNVSLKVDADSLHRQNQVVGGSSMIKETPSLLDTSDSWDEEEPHVESIFEVGVAYLVLFGNDGGTTLMDLPIKKRKRHFPQNILVSDDATLRIRVDVYPEGRKPRSPKRRVYSDKHVDQTYHLHDPSFLEPILRQLQVVEEMKAARMLPEEHVDQRRPSRRLFCGMMDLWNAVSCDDHADNMMLAEANSMDSTLNTAPSMAFW
eukprot:CAMPEP_0119028004 /NCGR_PEP_ID=MMETSP1176-20130426/38135_1 /TAXON_ID=265551 /ORGANISM="Synedropsis recta cf, Strain CCMP1620" /LENGTH=379 /DNA_ID=CAMNT_0006984047 /DNA_START=33 /DNA_END=1172 /DNA_ORIENTATION=+